MKETLGAAGSQMNAEFERDKSLADKFLAEADVKNLHALYQKRCTDLLELAHAFETMSELYAGKSERKEHKETPDAIASMERVSLAAIALSASIFDNFSKPTVGDAS